MFLLSIVILVTNIGLLLGGGIIVVKARRVILENIAAFEDYFTQPSETEPSPFNKTVNSTGEFIAAQVSDRVAGVLQGSIGGTMKGVTAELEKEAIAMNPAMAIMEGMPKAIKKNPLAYLMMQQLINKNIPGGGGAIGGNGRMLEQPKFNL